MKSKYFDRDLSWLSFNYRVLQEAKNKNVPLLERLKFLAIYSSNLDEFFSVRVAYHRNIIDLKIKSKKDSIESRKGLLLKIKQTVNRHLDEFGIIYKEVLLPELAQNNIFILDETQIAKYHNFISDYFTATVLPHLKIVFSGGKKNIPFLENKAIYFAVGLKTVKHKTHKEDLAFINIPSKKLPRFLAIPSSQGTNQVIFLDDVIRYCLPTLFPGYEPIHCHSIKIVRDAELFLEESDNLVDEIKRKIIKQNTNPPSRFLYDASAPKEFLKKLRNVFGPVKDYMIPGGRYHNYEDFISFPVEGSPDLRYPALTEVKNRGLEKRADFFSLITQNDHILHFPYQGFNYVVDFLENAAIDPDVKTIKITLYRVADESKIAKALIKAASNGKKVFAFVEIKARFDEIANIYWAQLFKEAGIKVIYSFKKIKVHSKMCLVERMEQGVLSRYAYLSTGNFNEKTAKIYCDHGYFTSRKELTDDANMIFDYLDYPSIKPVFKNFLVAPFNMRNKLGSLIRNEIKNAREQEKGQMILKMNSLEDREMIDQLYIASQKGVKITIIVRGICCLIPGVKGLSENIKVFSIVDRFLEHGRVFIFHNGGDEKIYISSADLMSRNLNKRIESAFPVLDPKSKEEIKHIINLQLKDNTKARVLNKTQSNPYRISTSKLQVRAQLDTFRYLKELARSTKNTGMVTVFWTKV